MFIKIERPKSFEYKIDKTKKWKFKRILEPKNMKTLFAIDCSGSVEGHELYHEELNKIWKNITKMMILYIYGIQLILFHMWLFKIRC